MQKYFKLRWFIILVLLFFSSCITLEEQPYAVNGTIDLSSLDFDKYEVIYLGGEWQFYWNEILEPKDFKEDSIVKSAKVVSIPGEWKANYSDIIPEICDTGYATYRLLVNLSGKR